MTGFKSILILFIIVITAALPSVAADSYRGEKTMGIYGGYTTRNSSATAGIFFQYRFGKYLRIAPSAGYDFRNEGEDAFNIDLDIHVPVALNSRGSVNIYPIAGLGYANISRREDSRIARSSSDSRQSFDRFGVNLGGGLEYFASPTLRLALEGKWRGRHDYPTGIFSVSIGYRF